MEQENSFRNLLSSGDVEDLMFFLEYNPNVNPEDIVLPGYTDALQKIILNGYSHYLEAIVKNGFDFKRNGFNYLLTSLLAVDSENRDFSMFKTILPCVDVSETYRENGLGISPWSFSFKMGYLKPITMMFEKGVDINLKDKKGLSGLAHFLRNNESMSDNFLKFVLKNKHKINWKDKDGFGVSIWDVLSSAKYSHDWIAIKNNQLLLSGLGIQYERK